jgi:hypothetical protein
VIDQMLRVDLDAPPKQRHTAKRIFDRLVEEHDAADVSYGMVRDYVAKRRPQFRLEAVAGSGHASGQPSAMRSSFQRAPCRGPACG